MLLLSINQHVKLAKEQKLNMGVWYMELQRFNGRIEEADFLNFLMVDIA